jgi:BolA protein
MDLPRGGVNTRTWRTNHAALTGRSGSRYADAMARRDLIAEKLTKAFAPASLDVVDESDRHTGHAGHREGGETHFRVHIVAEAFREKSRLERHRMILPLSSVSSSRPAGIARVLMGSGGQAAITFWQ